MSQPREVTRIVTAHRQTEGAGFIVRRPVPTAGLELVDPFLLIDELGPITYGPGEAIGAPDHPHRGFETVTYVLEGAVDHEDSAGHKGRIGPGDVQWMTAGAGIVHSEMPTAELLDRGGRVHGFQIWVNLPARLKLTQPRYQEIPAARIPHAETTGAKVRVIAGEVPLSPAGPGARAVIETHTPIVYQDWSLEPGADVTLPIDHAQQVLVYVFEGAADVGGKRVREGQLAILGAGDAVRLQGADVAGRLLLLAGTPLREPVARYGPFVMTSEREIYEAVRDFQSGKMGEITRSARVG